MYFGSMIPLVGGDGLLRKESGEGHWCDRCGETFYRNVEYTAEPILTIAWSEPQPDPWQPDPDEWKNE